MKQKFKYITLLFSIIILYSCSPRLNGLYKHQICKHGPNCFYYEFCSDGSFKYQFWQDILGTGIFTGTWSINNDTIDLKLNKYWLAKESKVQISDYKNSEKTLITVSLLRPRKQNVGDTLKTNWLISINDSDQYKSTNDKGELTIKKQFIKSIKIRDWFQQFNAPPMICIKDSLFKLNTHNNRIDIFVAECEYQPSMFEWMTKKFVLKGNKIYPITYEPEEALLGNKTYYKRVRRSCNNIKER